MLMFTLTLALALAVSVANAVGSRESFGSANIQVSCILHASGHDDAPALMHAAQRCSTVIIPKDTTLNIHTKLNMTGLTNTHISLQGKLKFNPDIDYWAGNAFFIPFQTQITFWLLGGRNVRLDGGGTIDGSGQIWWDTFTTNTSLLRPITLTLFQMTDGVVENINMINSPEWFNLCNECQHVTYSDLNINAVSTSSSFISNTDGWDVYRSDHVIIQNSVINNGDDCVSFKPNCTNIVVSNLHCNGSHGISVGSLGQYPGEYDIVENVTSSNVHMANAQNGARIKAWAGPNVGSGIVKNIVFENFVEDNVDNPLIIDQCYETNATACAQFPSNTYIQDVVFRSFSGTSSGKEGSVVASLGCSPDGRCSNITVTNVELAPPPSKGDATYKCQNVVVTGDDAGNFGSCATT